MKKLLLVFGMLSLLVAPSVLACDVPISKFSEKQFIVDEKGARWETTETYLKNTGCTAKPVVAKVASPFPYTLAVLRIEDYRLRRGVSLALPRDGKSEPFTLSIPAKKTFLPFPYYLPFGTGGVDPKTWEPGPLLVQVQPRLTKKANVNVKNTSEKGLVARVDYQGSGFFEVQDALQRLNRRDLNFGFKKGNEKQSFTFQVENMFDTFLQRRMSLISERKMTDQVSVTTRIDNLISKQPFRVGNNLVYKTKGYEVEIGNVGLRKVDEIGHAEIRLKMGESHFRIRNEGLGFGGNNDFPYFIRDQKHGGMAHLNLGDGLFSLALGNISLEDDDNEGRVTDKVHQRLTVSVPFGLERFLSGSDWNLTGEFRPGFGGVGDQRWGRTHLHTDVSFKRKHLLRLRYDDDYLRFQGPIRREYWQTFGASFNSFRDLFSKDRLSRLKVDAVFLDFESTRRRKGANLRGEWRMGASKLFRLKQYDIPLEFGIKASGGQLTPDIRFSIREFL